MVLLMDGKWSDFVRSNHQRFGSPYEELFVETVLAKVPGLDPGQVSCQHRFEDSKGRTRYIDFVVEVDGGTTLAIEVDGYDKTGRGSGASHDEWLDAQKREQDMKRLGFDVHRFPNRQVRDEPQDCIRILELVIQRASVGAGLDDTETRELAQRLRERDEEVAALREAARVAERRRWVAEQKGQAAEEKRHVAEERADQLAVTERTTRRELGKVTKWMWAFAAVVMSVAIVLWVVWGRSGDGSNSPPEYCPQGVSWSSASQSIGRAGFVYGPVVGASYQTDENNQPTFLNIGAPYPDSNRFTVVIWGRHRGNFSTPPESLYLDERICVEGVIDTYRGLPQIEVTSPASITIAP